MAVNVTLAQFKAYLQITGAAFDTTLQIVLDAGEQELNAMADRPLGFLQGARTDTISGNNAATIQLRYTPVAVASPITVTVNGSAVASDEYAVDPENGTLGFKFPGVSVFSSLTGQYSPFTLSGMPTLSPTFGNGFRQVVVTYTGGYAVAPAALVHATMQMAAASWYAQQSGPFKSRSLGSFAYTVADATEARASAEATMARSGLLSAKVIL